MKTQSASLCGHSPLRNTIVHQNVLPLHLSLVSQATPTYLNTLRSLGTREHEGTHSRSALMTLLFQGTYNTIRYGQ